MELIVLINHLMLALGAGIGAVVFGWVAYRIKLLEVDDHMYYLLPFLLSFLLYTIVAKYGGFLLGLGLGGVIKTVADLIVLVMSWISHVPFLRLPQINAPHE